ncbi:hypothetical protein RVR_8243 [Actinacidiphila reveromycinica]|uniref:Uncharacterized protein n=1 Tax=Actinacidiphila reveromycinica TaxID=659352 RepID=A0A7U3UYN0_9ACTN|nr:hypothetical protein [Streptomyces sp. SN-593]BBB01012.1 hypothetical protein RVR_8243 [Streptomyces sp. SN-593]
MSAPLSEQQLAKIQEMAARTEARPLLFSDCEGLVRVWAVSALKRIVRDGAGRIESWSEPFSYRPSDLVAEIELEGGTWDPGEDEADDQRRRDIGDLVAAREVLPALLTEVERLSAQMAAVRAFATSHEYRWLHELLDGPGSHGGAL